MTSHYCRIIGHQQSGRFHVTYLVHQKFNKIHLLSGTKTEAVPRQYNVITSAVSKIFHNGSSVTHPLLFLTVFFCHLCLPSWLAVLACLYCPLLLPVITINGSNSCPAFSPVVITHSHCPVPLPIIITPLLSSTIFIYRCCLHHLLLLPAPYSLPVWTSPCHCWCHLLQLLSTIVDLLGTLPEEGGALDSHTGMMLGTGNPLE